MTEFFAYVVECKIKKKWRPFCVTISPPGIAVRDFLDSVKKSKRNLCRIKRVKKGKTLRTLNKIGCDLMLHPTYQGEKIEMEDGLFEIIQED